MMVRGTGIFGQSFDAKFRCVECGGEDAAYPIGFVGRLDFNEHDSGSCTDCSLASHGSEFVLRLHINISIARIQLNGRGYPAVD